MTMMNERLDDRMMEGNPADFFAGTINPNRGGTGVIDNTMSKPIVQSTMQPIPTMQPAGEMINERMEWQSPARDKIIRNDLGLNPATLGAGFQMQGTNAPTALTDSMINDYTGTTVFAAGNPNLSGWQSGDPNPRIYSTGFISPGNQNFNMGSPQTGSPSYFPSNFYNNTGGKTFGYVNTNLNSLIQNPNFPMGGTYNYVTDPYNYTYSGGNNLSYNFPGGIMNYDPYNALANTGMYGYGFSQPNFPIMENFNQMFDPFQSYR